MNESHNCMSVQWRDTGLKTQRKGPARATVVAMITGTTTNGEVEFQNVEEKEEHQGDMKDKKNNVRCRHCPSCHFLM